MNKDYLQFFQRKVDKRAGVSLMEVTIGVAVVAILSLMFFAGATRQLSKSRDSQRKDDLQKIKIAFEDYYNDYQCYPDPSVMQNCGSEELKPYLRQIPCDPQDGQPYLMQENDGDVCTGYRVLVQLENDKDPDIPNIGCSPVTGCGYEDTSYNYGYAIGSLINESVFPTATPAPDVTPTDDPGATPTDLPPGYWVIAPDGTCDFYVESYYLTAGCPDGYPSFDACFAVSGCTDSCTEDDVPLSLRCER